MSYQVLARKYRPSNFHETVGQEHVLRALINALDNNRLHHAYLFTGTRGVGKTTIARVLAKCLNCEQGVTSKPCGVCNACRDISEGRFIDLIEVDAASRTKVEDTRELLENIQYAPTSGRFKVYLIDEVHMLSNHSFNALLKTLEEPPPHVKFLLATTDPQKLPITVLSRCLQFSLKNMTQERIVSHLSHVLEQESIGYDEGALWSIASAAEGSMRDALSLTDQAIAFGAGTVGSDEVNSMLGTIDRGVISCLLKALFSGSAGRLMSEIEQLSEQAPDYSKLLVDLSLALHKVAMLQVIPNYPIMSEVDRREFSSLAESVTAEDIQLYYQIAVQSRADLEIAPEAKSGFQMIMLRMLAFKPQGVVQVDYVPEDAPKKLTPQIEAGGQSGVEATSPETMIDQKSSLEIDDADVGSRDAVEPPVGTELVSATLSVADSEAASASGDKQAGSVAEAPTTDVDDLPPWDMAPEAQLEEVVDAQAVETPQALPSLGQADMADMSSQSIMGDSEAKNERAHAVERSGKSPLSSEASDKEHSRERLAELQTALSQDSVSSTDEKEQAAPIKEVVAITSVISSLAELNSDSFPRFALSLGLMGPTGSALRQMSLQSIEGNTLNLILDEAQLPLFKQRQYEQLSSIFNDVLDTPVELNIQAGNPGEKTPAMLRAQLDRTRHETALTQLNSDENIRYMIDELGGQLQEHTVVSNVPEEL